MKDKFVWILFFAITLFLLGFFMIYPVINYGGDIVEYYGITESLINHGSVKLNPQDQKNLEASLNPGYFNDPQYYIKGVNNDKYPVHFIFYSILNVPVRLFLKLIHLNELDTFRFTNLVILSLTVFILFKYFVKSTVKRLVLLPTIYLSPLVWFIFWPGPDVLYICLLLLAIFLFFNRRHLQAALLTGVASWHSQPLVIISLGFLFLYSYQNFRTRANDGKKIIKNGILSLGILAIPYLYNYLIFGILSPWSILQNGWTKIYGFGLQNASLQKLWEMFFDLNIGLFWYAPLLLLGGFYYLIKNPKRKEMIFIIFIIITTALAYQTNPAWNYGTSGYGPTRHVLFVLPFLIYFFVRNFSLKAVNVIVITLYIFTQGYILSFNGFLTPNLFNSFEHTPFAKYVLDNFPQFYNPSPEIFVDRTNHNDHEYLYTAIYQNNGICKKAYVLKSDKEKLKEECGFIPTKYESGLDDDLSRKANFPREIKTNEATFWPDPESCNPNTAIKQIQYVCMRTIDNVIKNTNIPNKDRITTLADQPFPGVWKLKLGDPLEITVPPGYIVQYSSLDGIYVNY